MRHYIGIFFIILIAFFSSCRNDFDFETSNGGLLFSKDTVYLDTVFTNIGSSTYSLKVYNTSSKNISIPSIRLHKGQASKYRLMVDGISGNEFTNIEMLAKDSMFVFIEVTTDVALANPTDFLYTDYIEFGNGTNLQKVELVTLIQDAFFLYPKKFSNGSTETLPIGDDEIYGFYLDENDPINGNELIWNNTKPYVVYGYAAVPPNKTLTVNAGARVHFHAESGLIVANNASLQVNGDFSTTDALENEVIFEGDRLEPDFSEVPGQWGTIWFTQGSTANTIKNLTLKNASVGLLISGNDGTTTPSLTLKNTQIYNCSNVGILARTGNITGKNVVTNNCGEAGLACTLGGFYEFTHCTFANYWGNPNQTCVLLNDNLETSEGVLVEALTQANFINCIMYGSSSIGISHKALGNSFNFKYSNCLIKFIDPNSQFVGNELYDFSNNTLFENCLIASTSLLNQPNFFETNNNKLIIGENSAAINQGLNLEPNFNDILNKTRAANSNTNPDLGAYNFIVFD
ncbi:hypothetical protein [uncultured Flavobacterium sp.]|uniref:hypothetical protein n=1 Tax=uncultured Flavobacterium sp. TaxID=165435 RepID=UPI0030CA42D9